MDGQMGEMPAMTLRNAVLTTVIVLFAAMAAAADRLTDKDVKDLISRIEQGRDRFDDALDDKLKNQIVRGPSGETDVKRFLNDFQESIDRVEQRLKPEYAASAEVGTLLRQASAIDRFFRNQQPGTKGESEWNRLATDFKTLAAAYGTEFPISERASVRRIGDRELEKNVDGLAKTAENTKKALDKELKKDPSMNAARQGIVADVDRLSKDAKTLKSRVKDGKPSSAEARSVLERAAKLHDFVKTHQVPVSTTTWNSAAGQLQNIASAYGATPPKQ
jgi:membrane-bound lytic murein transglycosylase B